VSSCAVILLAANACANVGCLTSGYCRYHKQIAMKWDEAFTQLNEEFASTQNLSGESVASLI
jgi:hypothetical protein